jgi:hypothetical protein
MRVLIILICLLFALSLFGERLTTFPQIYKPKGIWVGENLVCISEGAAVFLYDLNDFKLIKKFGRRGEGPREFSGGLIINILKEKIMIESQKKLSFYSLKGDFIKEMRRLPKYRGLKLLEDRYVASSGILSNDVYHNVAKILDADFNELKTFYHDEARYHQKKQVTNFSTAWYFDVSEKKCFIVGSTDFKINVFNKNGDSLYTISPKYERVKVSQEFIDIWFEYIKKRRGMAVYHNFKQRVRFPEFFPAILDLIVDSGHVYVLTFGRKQEKSEFIIFDLEGKLVKKTFLPLKDSGFGGVFFFPYCIKNNYLYQLIENEEEEVLELQRFSIL